jgi:type III restriction enzyme
MNAEWKYALLGETTFYSLKDRGASVQEILEFTKLTRERVKGPLF